MNFCHYLQSLNYIHSLHPVKRAHLSDSWRPFRRSRPHPKRECVSNLDWNQISKCSFQRRLSNVKYGSACGRLLRLACRGTRAPCSQMQTAEEESRPFTLKCGHICRLPLFRRWLLPGQSLPFSKAHALARQMQKKGSNAKSLLKLQYQNNTAGSYVKNDAPRELAGTCVKLDIICLGTQSYVYIVNMFYYNFSR